LDLRSVGGVEIEAAGLAGDLGVLGQRTRAAVGIARRGHGVEAVRCHHGETFERDSVVEVDDEDLRFGGRERGECAIVFGAGPLLGGEELVGG
jgi:hypothetical protein